MEGGLRVEGWREGLGWKGGGCKVTCGEDSRGGMDEREGDVL